MVAVSAEEFDIWPSTTKVSDDEEKVKDEWDGKRKRLRELGSWAVVVATLTLDLGL